MNLQLQHRTALITGAKRRIGAGMVRVWRCSKGSRWWLPHAQDRLQALADEVERQGRCARG